MSDPGLPFVEFHGATGEVTGSCYLLHTARGRVLLDCGLVQGDQSAEERNRDPFPFDPAGIDAVVLSHAHIDHSGRLPLLVARGYRGPVYTHPATADLCAVMLEDSGYLQEKDAAWENRRRERRGQPPVEPLYTREEARATTSHFRGTDYERETEIIPGVGLVLHDAGHILGSAIVELRVADGDQIRTLVFSGDLGHKGAPILRDPTPVAAADLVMMESTYGDRLHRSWAATWEELGEIISSARSSRGNILIPAFAVGRTQELLYVFARHFDEWGLGDWRIFLDSPMAIRATAIYRNHPDVYDAHARRSNHRDGRLFDMDNLHFSETTEQSMGINHVTAGAIVIAGSGMCTGGRIRHHLRRHLSRAESRVVIVGFQAAGTLGRRLVDGARQVSIMGREYDVRASIHTVGGLSAHADRQGLIDWYGGFVDRPRVALVHGEPDAADSLQRTLVETLSAPVLRPRRGQKIPLRAD